MDCQINHISYEIPILTSFTQYIPLCLEHQFFGGMYNYEHSIIFCEISRMHE